MSLNRRGYGMIYPEDGEDGDIRCKKAFAFGYLRGKKSARGVTLERLPLTKMYECPERMAYYRGFDKGRREK